MNRVIVIARRELSSYFHSPVAYVAMVLFLLASGLVFLSDFQPGQPAAMRGIFDWMVWFLVFICPILCMGLMSQEWASGTIETMMTAPINDSDIVLGKFFGSLSFFAILISPTLVYLAVLSMYGRPDYGPIFSGYLGILLVGALFIAVTLFCSALTRFQMIAAVLSMAILFLITVVPWLVASLATLPDFLRACVDQTVFRRYTDFSKGVIDTGNLVFFVLATGAFLFVTTKVIEARRWK